MTGPDVLAELRLKLADAGSEVVRLEGDLRQSRALTASATARLAQAGAGAAAREAELLAAIAGSDGVAAALRVDVARLSGELAALRASASWRIAFPVRFAGRAVRWVWWRIVWPLRQRRSVPAQADVAAPPEPADPAAATPFQPAPGAGAPNDPVTLDELYRLSRPR